MAKKGLSQTQKEVNVVKAPKPQKPKPAPKPAPQPKEPKEPQRSKADIKHDALVEVQREEDILMRETLRAISGANIRSPAFKDADFFLGMVAQGDSYGCILEGPPGISKTFRTLKALNSVKGLELAYTDSFTTPQAFYCWLYKNKDKHVVVCDDVAGLMNNEKVLAMLKGALWPAGSENKRVVTYLTSKRLENDEGYYVPQRFEFNARMVMLTNKLNQKSAHIQAVLSRIDHCRIEVSRDEMLEMMEQVAKADYPNINKEERSEVLDFLRERLVKTTANINLRTLIKAFQYFIFSKRIAEKDMWQEIILRSIEEDELLVVVSNLMDNDKMSSEQKVDEFMRITRKSRPTFFRLQAQVKKQREERLREEKEIEAKT